MSLVDTCKKNEENLKENFLSVSQYYHIRGNFLGVVYLFLFQKKMTNLVFFHGDLSLWRLYFLKVVFFSDRGGEA